MTTQNGAAVAAEERLQSLEFSDAEVGRKHRKLRAGHDDPLCFGGCKKKQVAKIFLLVLNAGNEGTIHNH